MPPTGCPYNWYHLNRHKPTSIIPVFIEPRNGQSETAVQWEHYSRKIRYQNATGLQHASGTHLGTHTTQETDQHCPDMLRTDPVRRQEKPI